LHDIGAEQNTLVFFLSDNGGCHEKVDQGKAGAPLGTRDSFSSYRRAWAQVSNTPFRLYKHWTQEGGIATPLIARWPGKIQPGGDFYRGVGNVIDFMPTALAAAGAPYPKTFNKHEITPAEGVSLLPALLHNESLARSQPLFWEHEGNRAVRDGKWKLVAEFNKPWELHDMEKDRNETHDLAADEPDKVKELSAKFDAWAERCEVRDWKITKDSKK
jgi:arylsulfatase